MDYDTNKPQKIFEAIIYATEAHHGQYRKGTNIPYIVHPINVMRILIDLKCDEDVIIAGLLHDVVEDANKDINEIREKFGSRVTEIINALTEPIEFKRNASTWKERKLHSLELIENTDNFDILFVACADKYDNCREILLEYSKIGEKIWEKFNAPKNQQKWYYESLKEIFLKKAQILNSGFTTLALQYAEVVNNIFKDR